MRTILYYELKGQTIHNLDQLPRGTNAPYLECITAHDGSLIAKCWRRNPPKSYDVLIQF